MMPELLAERHGPDNVSLRLRVPITLEHFTGHFPQFPILPGVVQIDWAVRLGRRYFAMPRDCYGVQAFKCRAPVAPGAELLLTLGYDPARSSLEFSYVEGGRPVSSGTMVFR